MAVDWKNKLAAFLHDSPSKVLDLTEHQKLSETSFRQAGFQDEDVGNYLKGSDHAAAAADRFPFPSASPSGLRCAFDGVRNAFIHPFSNVNGIKIPLKFEKEFSSAELAIEGENSIQPCLSEDCLKDLKVEEQWRARFFAHWRLWRRNAVKKDYRLGFLPADTRIPDHTIWTHNQVTSAIAGCFSNNELKAAFLKFQIGPVQEFIAAARSIRDLWSGSFLLSWLMTAGLKALSEEVGPDAVIFPSLYGQPLFDLRWRDELWAKVKIGSSSIWDDFEYKNEDLLVPNLPNVFLAIVPQGTANEIADKVKNAIQDEWKKIATSVWNVCDKAGLTADEGGITREARKQRFFSQVDKFLSISYQITPWTNTIDDAVKLAESFDSSMPIFEAKKRIQEIIEMATKKMPKDHRDSRLYSDREKENLNNIGLMWSIFVAFNGWALDAVRQVRAFRANGSGGWDVGTFNNKDALTGREEAVAGGHEWLKRCSALAGRDEGTKSHPEYGKIAALFKHDDWLGATTLIKRTWHLTYLGKEPWSLKVDNSNFPMPNTRGIAAHTPFKDCGEDLDVDDVPMEEKYFAVLALDGDEIGKWISGENNPIIKNQLAEYTDGSGNQAGALEYFNRDSNPDGKGSLKNRYQDFLNVKRPVSPSYHLQFSEALSNFALQCAKPIVEAFDGRLIYAGGDDVLALLPFDTAVPCAQALRMAFRGDVNINEFVQKYTKDLKKKHEEEKNRPPYYQNLFVEGNGVGAYSEGFLTRLDFVDYNDKPIPFIVPGPSADCSVGIAIGHFKAPLQDIVKAAQAAEKTAKNKYGRSAIAISLFKRSGEILEWGCKWDSGGLDLLNSIVKAINDKKLSVRFPHRICEILEKYISDVTNLDKKIGSIKKFDEFEKSVDDIIRSEFNFVLGRQTFLKGEELRALKDNIKAKLDSYIESFRKDQDKHNKPIIIEAEQMCQYFIGLCQTAAFTYRAGDLSAEEEQEELTNNNQHISR